MTKILTAFFLLAFFYCIIVAVLYFKQAAILYQPPRWNKAPDKSSSFIEVQTLDGLTLRAKFKPPENENLPTILIFHGNAEDLSNVGADIALFLQKGYGVLLAEYRGYLGNPGTPSEAALKADSEIYWQFLLDKGISSENIIVYGRSLGSGIATHLADRTTPKGLILVVPYCSVYDIAHSRYPFIPFLDRLLKDKYDNIRLIGEVTCPKLVILAENDAVIPVQLGKKLYQAASEPKELYIAPETGHNSVYIPETMSRIGSFIENLNERHETKVRK